MRDRTLKYVLVLPAVVVVFATAIWPLLDSAHLSFRVWKLSRTRSAGAYVGVENYQQALASPDFLNAVVNTVLFVTLSVLFTTLLALGLALLLAKGGPLRKTVQALLILPFAMSPALVGVSFRFMFHPEFGLFAAVFGTIFPPLAGVNWLATPSLAFTALVMADVWAWTPFMTLVLIGGLAAIPRDTIEAASVDGAASWRVVWDITIPQLRPVLAVVVILKTIFAMKAFEIIYMLTQGGPGTSTQTLVYFTYLNGFKYYDMGYAAALAWFMVVPMMGLTYLYTRFVFRRAA
jgi:multiple sugar transport system permease protein